MKLDFIEKILALYILLIISPIILIIYINCLLFQGLPIFYKCRRIGKNCNSFELYKFRSMKLSGSNDNERITYFGKFLRRTSLDELPQLFNILKGDMKFIGPRPLPINLFNSSIMQRYLNERHSVYPGLTGLAQSKSKGIKRSKESKLIYDIYYVRNKSIKLDIYILIQTSIALIKRMVKNKEGISL